MRLTQGQILGTFIISGYRELRGALPKGRHLPEAESLMESSTEFSAKCRATPIHSNMADDGVDVCVYLLPDSLTVRAFEREIGDLGA